MPSPATHHRPRQPGPVDTYTSMSSLLTGLVAYWKLEEASGTRFDSCNSNNLTPAGTVTQAVGKLGNAIEVATGASANYLSAGTALTPLNSSRSVSMWVYPTNVSAQRTPMSSGTSATTMNPHWLIVLRRGGASGPIAVYHGAAYRNGTTVAALNTWYHIVYTFDSSSNAVTVYVNGVQEALATAGDANSTTNLYLGAGVSDFAGRLDEVGIWNRALTSDEVTALYNSGNAVTYPTFS